MSSGAIVEGSRAEMGSTAIGTHLFVRDQTVKNREHLFAVVVHALQIFAEGGLEIRRFHPLVDHGAGHVDILPEVFYIMSAEEEAVEKGRFPLRRQGVEFVSRRHKCLSENVSIPMA